jgi:predicted RNA-binding Zn-ribbon protein involved in translation (DUF1610 family)
MSVKFRVIQRPEPDRRVLHAKAPDGPILRGSSWTKVDFGCGSCGRLLVTGLKRPELKNIVIQCPSCGSYNDTGA